jgi:nitroreductase
MSLSASEVHRLKKAPVVDGVLPVFLERWSARSFAYREVSDSDLKRVFEAARWSASANNAQPWRFLLGRKGTETHTKLVSILAGFNKAWAPKAPVLILGTAKAIHENGSPNAYALYDLGAATVSFTLQAAALGFTTHQMAGYDHDAARKALAIPEDYALGTIVALGYQDEPAALDQDELIRRETTPRERKPLKDIVFSSWGDSANL